MIVKEVCVENIYDALSAFKKGANRLELCSDLEQDGLTPSYGLLSEVKLKLTLPLNLPSTKSPTYLSPLTKVLVPLPVLLPLLISPTYSPPVFLILKLSFALILSPTPKEKNDMETKSNAIFLLNFIKLKNLFIYRKDYQNLKIIMK